MSVTLKARGGARGISTGLKEHERSVGSLVMYMYKICKKILWGTGKDKYIEGYLGREDQERRRGEKVYIPTKVPDSLTCVEE